MKLLVLLLVLALRRLELAWPAWLLGESRVSRLLLPCWQRLGKAASVWHWCLAVVLPALVLALVFYGLGELLGGLFGWLLGAILLLWLWGAQSEFRQLEALLALGRMQDNDALYVMAEETFQVKPGRDFFLRLQQAFLLRDARVLFASIFWLVLLGYWAVFLYLVNRLYLQIADGKASRFAQALDEVLFWPVARLLVLCLALASDFTQVMAQVKGRWIDANNDELLQLALAGVLASPAQASDKTLSQQMDRLEELHAALLRTLALWLVVAAVWIMLFY